MNYALPLLAALASHAMAQSVTLLRVPDNGVQPQLLVDSKGTLHLIFLAGPAPQSDVFHTTLEAQTQTFAKPQRVNQTTGSAIAVGTIRGAQCAFGKDDQLHILWNGGGKDGEGKHRGDVFYTRSDGRGGFQPERAMMHVGMYLDGGASVAADGTGNVYAMWHAAPLGTPPKAGEMARRVYLSASHDSGQTFATEIAIKAADTGVCGCCSMRATASSSGEIIALYRSADGRSRGIQRILSGDKGSSFTRDELQPWPINACPMSSSFIKPTSKGMLAAWETDGAIWMSDVGAAKARPEKIAEGGAKHPCIAINERGETLITWAVGTGWQRGGSVAWSLRSADGKALAQTKDTGKGQPKLPVWSYPAAAFVKGLGFVVVH